MKKLTILAVLSLSLGVAQARNLKPSPKLPSWAMKAGAGGLMIVAAHLYIVAKGVHVESPQASEKVIEETRDYQQLIQQLSLEGNAIDNDDSVRYDGEELSAADYDGLIVYYQQGDLHTTGTAVALPELGTQILLIKKDGAFNQLIHTEQIVGVAIADSAYAGLPIAVPTEESDYVWQPVPNEFSPDFETIVERGHLLHGDVVQQFTSGWLLVASSYTVDKDGKVTPLENPRNIFAPASKVTWFDPDAPIPTAQKCEQCHDAEFPNED